MTDEPFLSFWELSRWYTYGALHDEAGMEWRRQYYDKWRNGGLPARGSGEPAGEIPAEINVTSLLSRLGWGVGDLSAALGFPENSVSAWTDGNEKPGESERAELLRLHAAVILLDRLELNAIAGLLKEIRREGAANKLEIYAYSPNGGTMKRVPYTHLIDARIDPHWRDGDEAALVQAGKPTWVKLRFRRENVLEVWPDLAREAATSHDSDPVAQRKDKPNLPQKERNFDPREDAEIRKRIEAVLAHYHRWPSAKKRKGERQRARLLYNELKDRVDLGEEAMRQIIRGDYPPMIRLRIPKPS